MATAKVQLTTLALMGISTGVGCVITYLVLAFLKKTIGTRYVSEKKCSECSVRSDVSGVKRLCGELAIKAGVPPHIVMEVVVEKDHNHE